LHTSSLHPEQRRFHRRPMIEFFPFQLYDWYLTARNPIEDGSPRNRQARQQLFFIYETDVGFSVCV
jgi:hypothetical protein